MTNLFPRETVEFQGVTVTVDGTPVVDDVEFAVTAAAGERPLTWVAPVALSGQIGVMVDGMDPGTYRVWARITSYPEVPIVECGCFRVT